MAISHPRAVPRPASIPRYLLLQASIGVALGTLAACALPLINAFGLADLLAAASFDATTVFLLGGITTLTPLVFATAVGLLAQDLYL